jgi:exodeoxyribonuclease-3
MRITTLNCNGLRAAAKKGFADWLARTDPDVLCLQEVRAEQADLPAELWNPPGYSARWYPAEKKGYSGTSAWARATTGARFTVGTGHTRGDSEGRVVGVHLPELDVWSMYLPSGSSGPERQAWKCEYMEHILPWMQQVADSGRPALVCGDLNIAHTPMDIRNAKSNQKNSGFLPEERAWLDQLVAMGWRDIFRELNPTSQAYSWWSQRGNARANDVGWRIDHIWATPGLRVKRVWIEREAALSDHAPVHAELALE